MRIHRNGTGSYAKARRVEIKGFTGIDDPYEVPVDADLVLEGATGSSWDFTRRIIEHLVTRGYLPVSEPGGEGTREMSPRPDGSGGGSVVARPMEVRVAA